MRWQIPDDRRAILDAALAAGLVVVLVAQVLTLDVAPGEKAGVCVWAAALLVPLALRRRVPVTLLALVVAGGVMGSLLPKAVTDVEAVGPIVLLAVYTAAAHTSGRRTVAAGALTATLAVGALVGDPDGVYLGGIIFFALLFGGPWVAGRVVRRRRESERRIAGERDAAQAAIAAERARIARELHDVVAHAISVIVLQARGGRALLDEDPEETRGALDTIERTGQQALVEMRRLVGLLREDDGTLALAPQPGLGRIDALVGDVRDAGLPVQVRVEGAPVALPPGVDLSAFRIVQEALTNALKHAGPARALVVLRYEDDGIVIDVTDDGGGDAPPGDGSGHGLAGIRERVALFGGELEAGPGHGGGFAVRARLPFASAR
ncbi:MAG TPA: histidine kinase [Miltoncostaeaceae bacterium]|nr:histidine kinase [Miltoncostaeaceae bacterium]